MNKAILILAIVSVSSIAAQAQMGGGMMHEGQGGGAQTSQKATTGQEVFNANCSNCHPNGGNSITPALPLKGSLKLADFKAFLKFIRQPKMPDGSTGAMPAFSKSQITDKQAKTLYKYVSSF